MLSTMLDDNQMRAVDLLRSGSILVGGVGSGKSRTGLYFWLSHYGNRKLYIITTPHKRDTKDWSKEAYHLGVASGRFVVDSWNNIEKYIGVRDAFFIFDEQRLVGKGTWAKTFLRIAKNSAWIVLTATPGDVWMDYATIFIANGFYKNRTDFCREHVVYSRVARFPKVERYIEEDKLRACRDLITVHLESQKETVRYPQIWWADYDKEAYKEIVKTRWNKEKNEPFADGNALCYGLRKAVVQSENRMDLVRRIILKHGHVIIFYNFDYELEMLKEGLCWEYIIAEWNGHKHEPLPSDDEDWWVYLVQYNAGAEAWECITANAILFFSPNYSYKIMEQAAGRIDRRNTPFKELYYYCLATEGTIETKILSCLKRKRNFNEGNFVHNLLTNS